MDKKHTSSRSIATQFTRHYLIVSIIPLGLLLILFLTGVMLAHNHITRSITHSTTELNKDAQQHLQQLGEQIIQAKARDVAKQIEIYFRMHPDMDIQAMRRDPFFMDLAVQQVGETGYTVIVEAHTAIFRVHPNMALNDQPLKTLAEKLPSWWKIVENGISGVEAAGYYDWQEPDGSVRQKFLAVAPVLFPLRGATMTVSATTYIDEFSTPIIQMRHKADRVVTNYQQYVSDRLVILSILAAIVILLTFLGIFFLGRRAGLHQIVPMMKLAETAKHLGEGNWNVQVPDRIDKREDEIGITARSFNRMSQQLKETFERLERRVNELHETQNALKQSEEHFKALYEESRRAQEVYRSLINSSADAIVTCDLKGCVTYASPMFTTLFGWSFEELLGKPVPFVSGHEDDMTLSVIRQVIENGSPCQNHEIQWTSKDGRDMDVSISASRYNDHEGKPAGILVILRDISEAKKIEEHMEQIERLETVGTLAGGIAHDFNNLLTVIQGTVSLLTYNTPMSDSHYKYYVDIEKQVQRGAKLTRQLLGYARKGKYEVRPINLNDIIMESAEAIRRTRKDIRMHFHLDPAILTVEADIYQMEQVLMNLYINAADAMPKGGDLTLATSNISSENIVNTLYPVKEGLYVSLRLEDTGIGMDKNTQDRIFEPFFTTKAVDKGTGLGLASVYGIVKSHGGYISVKSEIGKGSTFSIYLPASDKSLPEKIVYPKKSFQGRGTILLIDDERPVLDVASDMLKSIGYETLRAGHGRQGLEIYEKEAMRIDLVILDMIMPDMGGGEVFDRLRVINPDVCVLLSSGYSIDGRASDILDRGCNGFIQKPFSMEDLAEKIARLLKT